MQSGLRASRQQRGWVIWALSANSGVSPATICAIELHGYVPSAHTRQKLADALGCEPTTLCPAKHKRGVVGR